MSPIDNAVAAVIAALHHQGEITGNTAQDDGRLVQVDGSFAVEPLVRAILKAIREPSEAMLEVDALRPDGSFFAEDYWKTMIDVALQEG